MTKLEKRQARNNLKKLFTMLTWKERKLYRKDRRIDKAKQRKKASSRTGIKAWIIQNNPKQLPEMLKLGLIKKESIHVNSKARSKDSK